MREPSSPNHIQERSVQYRGRAFTLLALVQVTLILAITVVAIGLPAIQRDLDLRPGQLALVSAGYGLAFSGLLLLGGRLADVLRPRRTFLIGLVVFGVASIGVGFASGFISALVARLGQGVGAALAAPSAMALLRTLYPEPAEHTRAAARWGALAPIGATAGILASGLAVTAGSWRAALVIPVAVAAVGVATARAVLPDPASSSSGRLDLPGAALAAGGIGALSFGLVTAGDHGWSSPLALGALSAGVLALVGFAVVETTSRTPLVPPSFLRTPGRAVALIAVMVAAAGHASTGFFLALYFQQVRGMSALATTAAFLPLLLVLPLAGMASTRLLRAFRPLPLTATGLAIAAVGLAALARITPSSPYAGMTLIGLLLLPVGVGLTFSATTVVAVHGADRSRAGLAGGLLNTAIELGPALGLAGLVALATTRTSHLLDHGWLSEAATTGGYHWAFIAAAAVLVTSASAIALVSMRRSPRPPGPTDVRPHPNPTHPGANQ